MKMSMASPATITKSILLTVLSVSLLTACGGSGGDTKKAAPNPAPNTNPVSNPVSNPETNSNSLINRPFYRVCADRVEKYLFLDVETLVISKKYSKVSVSNSTLLVEIKGSDITIREDVYSASKPNIEPLTLKNSDSGELVFYFSREKAEKLPAKTCLDPVYGRSGAYEYDSEGRVISSTQTNKNGISTQGTHTYNKKGEKSSTIVYFDKDGIEKSRRLLSFDLNGNITKKKDIRPDGTFIETRNSYNADDEIVKVTWLKSDGAHGKTDTTYFKNGEIKSKVYFSYNADDEITNQGHRTNNEQGKPLTNNYSYTGGTAYVNTYTYYKNGNKKSETSEQIYANGKSRISQNEYDTSGEKSKIIVTDYNADKTVKSTAEYSYINGREKVISKVETGTDGIKVTSTYSYNSEGNILSTVTAKSDGTSGKTKVTYQRHYTYNEQGKVLTDNYTNEDGSGRVDTYSYYDNGNTKSRSNKYLSADGSDYVSLIQYDTNKNKTKDSITYHHIDGSVKSTRAYDYDSQGKVTKKVETNSEGVTTTELFTYNADGKIINWTKSDGTSGKTLTVYHSNGEKKSEDRFAYNSADKVTYQRHRIYNEQGKLLTDNYTNEDGSGYAYTYSYYANGKKKTYSWIHTYADGRDYEYLYEYDSNETQTKYTLTHHNADGSVKSIEVKDYNTEGKVTKKVATNSEGVTTTNLYAYNTEGKVLSDNWSQSDGTHGKVDTAYHSNGNKQSQDRYDYNSANEVIYQRHYTYNEQGKVLTDNYTNEDSSGNANTYSYYANGKKKTYSWIYTYADGRDYGYLYEYDSNETKTKDTLTHHNADGSVESTTVITYYLNGQKKTSLIIIYDTAGNETSRTSRAWNEDGTEV